jgi:phosphoglucosamine mutase
LAKQLFGTDGIRGVAGEYPLDRRTVFAFGEALGEDVMANGRGREVLIGADTRESGRWIAETVAGGLETRGVRTRYAGVITTPGVAWLTCTGPFAAGVMISASHNPYEDNGIKVFGHGGFKLPDDEEHAIEEALLRLRAEETEPRAAPLPVDEDLDRQYLEYLRSTATVRFEGVRVVLDCGNGAAWRRSCSGPWAPMSRPCAPCPTDRTLICIAGRSILRICRRPCWSTRRISAWRSMAMPIVRFSCRRADES